jgi:O-antigen ligase
VARDRLGAWCGWVMLGGAVLVPLLGWLAPLGFAPLLALMGLLCLPALRLADEDRPVMIVLLGVLVWAAASVTWSPSHPKKTDQSVILQLALALPLFWSAICGARRADPRLNALALRVLAIGLALFATVLMGEVLTNAGIFRRLHDAYYEPIRIDLAQARVAHSSFVLALLWPAVIVGGLRLRWEVGLLPPVLVGLVAAAHTFGADAPVLAFPIASGAMLIVWLWPRFGPWAIGLGAAALGFLMPLIIWSVRASGHYGEYEQAVQLSWAARMSIWSHAIDRIAQQPMRGWGLDASRTMGPEILLHPHNGALQVWLELGFPGAVAAAVFWALSIMRLSRDEPELELAGVAGSIVTFLLFAWVNYGQWQGWWLALGAYVAVVAAMLTHRGESPKST